MKAKPMISPDLLERIVNESQDGIVIAEQEGDENILIYVNKGFEQLTGYSADEILYQDCRFLQGDDRDQPALERIRAAIRENRPCREILRNYRKDGSLFWNELSITPVFNDEDQLTYFIGVQKDVTELMQLRQASETSPSR
ncbi:PAS domain-containing protein [Marinospirillum alkaliphilum]|uniref:PAS domain S-box-containing protein n=1 Tax=Marinospirillum alkaliphilum DSM 21637 TaxID=1122209 RepID=A0A1K1V428_9GAMM|nr:PAS domain-containing protein [Marinospirillum alkaliphilum]SFX19913.1 PAS domain S-box-containing protein [Marinospirillum alkaliphilum DSM 21637]